MSSYRNIIFAVVGLILAYTMLCALLFILFKGYAPFRGRKRVMADSLFKELGKEKLPDNPVIYCLGSGQFGFLYQAALHWPGSVLTGVTRHWPTYLMSLLQLSLRREFWKGQIKLIRSRNFYKLRMADANIVVFYQGFDILKELAKKLKFECKSGTIMLAGNASIPDLLEKRSFFIDEPAKKKLFRKEAPIDPAVPVKVVKELYFLYEI